MPLGANKAAIMGVAGTAVTGDIVLLNDGAFSNQTTVSFTSSLTSKYVVYVFGFYNINPATDNVDFTFQVNATDGADYNDSPITSTVFYAYHGEGDDTALEYASGSDLTNAASFQIIGDNVGNGADESLAGIMYLFNPSSTTYVKHFITQTAFYQEGSKTFDHYAAGYISDATAIDDIQFKMSSGNFDGEIKVWGVKK